MAIPVTAVGKQNYKKENNKEEGNTWEKQKNKQKKNDMDSKVEALIDQPRDTTLHRNNAATFVTGKQKNKTFGRMHQKTENKGN